MTAFDGVALPFDTALFDGAISVFEEMQWMAFARQLVMQEIQNSSSTGHEWAAAVARSEEEQRSHAQNFRNFQSDLVRQFPDGIDKERPSPISGAVQHSWCRSSCGLLDRVEVSSPPVALRRATVHGGSAGDVPRLLRQNGQGEKAEEEEPLFLSSSPSVTSSMAPGMASQAHLDGVFFEALLSQELSITLWRNSGVPEETLQSALSEMQLLGHAACEEDTKLRYINSIRFSEQRRYKRRRTELQSQLRKVQDKVFALEKLVGADRAELKTREVGSGARLRASLLD